MDIKFCKIYLNVVNEDSNIGYFFEVEVHHPRELHDLHNNLPFLPGKIDIRKVEKFVTILCDKKSYVKHIRNLEQEINFGLILKSAYKSH